MKTCCRCKIEKPVTEFYIYARSKDGFQAACKPCQKTYSNAFREARMTAPKAIEVKSKVCYSCGLEKPSSQFGKKSFSLDKLNEHCKPCWRKLIYKYKEKHLAKKRAEVKVQN